MPVYRTPAGAECNSPFLGQSNCVRCQGISSDTPGSIGSDHGVKDEENFMHTCSKGNLWELTGANKTFVESSYNGVVTDRGEGCHV